MHWGSTTGPASLARAGRPPRPSRAESQSGQAPEPRYLLLGGVRRRRPARAPAPVRNL